MRLAGLILADSANMVMRISYSWHFIKSAVPGLRITAWAPSFVSCCAATAAAVALRKLFPICCLMMWHALQHHNGV